MREQELGKDYKNIDKILQKKKFLYIPEAVKIELINQHHDDLLAKYFEIVKIREMITRKYY